MWYLDRLEGIDFMSYEGITYDFQKGATTLIYGVNNDEPGADSNGAGKSAIVKAITIVLLDMPDKSLVKEEYISDWSDNTELSLTLRNNVHNKTLKINRKFRRNKDSSVSLEENGVENKSLTSIGECNKRILALLDISREDLLNYYIINQDNSNSFFEATDGNQKATITRFINADIVDSGIAAVQRDIELKNKEIEDVKSLIQTNDTKIEVLSSQIEYEKNERLGDIEEEKKKYLDKVNELKNKIPTCKEELSKYKLKLLELEEQFTELESEIDRDKISEIEGKIKKSKRKLVDCEESISEVRKPLVKIKNILAGKITCPNCSFEWAESSDGKPVETKELNDQVKEYEEMIEQIKDISKTVENRIAKQRKDLSHSNTQIETFEALEAEISRNKRKLNSSKQSIEDFNEEIKMYQRKINDMSQRQNDTIRISTLEEEITQLSDQNQEFTDKLSSLNEEKNELTYWNINLGVKGFKSFLVNKILFDLEGHVNLYLSKFKTDLIVRIQGFKTLKTGEIRENISISISRDGGDTWKPFKRHSGGQRRRIDVCGILTVQSFINNSSKYGGLDLLILDEFFEGLDAKGQQGVLKILEQSKITTLVISHNNNDIGAENQIWVNYKDKISNISNEKIQLREDREDKKISISKKKVSS